MAPRIALARAWKPRDAMDRDSIADLTLRRFEPSDSIRDLTQLLHRAYERLALRGLRAIAVDQDESTTRRRAAQGECWIAIDDERIVGTIVVEPPSNLHGSPWYELPRVGSVHQFGVDPVIQGLGVGSRLLQVAEERAAAMGCEELALDTPETADDLIAFYTRRGYRIVEHAQWPETNYRSVILSKRLAP